MTLELRFHPEARAELLADVKWYDDREFGLGGRFGLAVRSAVDAAAQSPDSWALWPGWDREPVVRSKGVGDFPYRVVYVVRNESLIVVAVAHTKRRPGYWRERVPAA
ncbi:type II toxin-antitoxin system RelE/ParE family toxin [Ruania albidiflava]|uniref:type II toxin-antitoxin system RelE/ParE family toxin n=1 Tax=Ruania albidiflava TaxID=366586 RepID=UPI0009FE2C69